MPEIKHNFTGGKMNKDVDERLVPKGEYRDAMNIQVSTSEGSDVGTVQNILGNNFGCNAGSLSGITSSSTTVGSVTDERTDSLYWFISGGQPQPGPNVAMRDSIWRRSANGDCKPVFVDNYGISLTNTFGNTFNSSTLTNITSSVFDEIEVGWTVVGVANDGTFSNTATISSFNTSPYIPFDFGFTPTTNTVNIESGVALSPMIDVASGISFVMVQDINGNFSQSTLNEVYLQGWSGGSVNQLVGDTIEIPAYSGNTYVINAANTVNLTYVSGVGVQAVKLTLDTNTVLFQNPPLDPSVTAELTSGIGLVGSYNGSSISALITSSDQVTTNIANGEIIFNIADYNVTNAMPGGVVTITNNSSGFQNSADYCVQSIDSSNNSITLQDCQTGATVLQGFQVGGMIYSQPQPTGGVVQFAVSGAVELNQSLNLIGDYQALYFQGPRTLNFNNTLITGINIIDDMLFWTDNETEPKKINIPRSIEGTNGTGIFHTKLIVNGVDKGLTKEKHVTVIKRAPKKGVSMGLTTSRDTNLNYSGVFTISDTNNLAQSSLWDQRDPLNVNPSYPYDLSTFTTQEGSNIFKIIVKSDLNGNTNFALDGWGVGTKVAIKEFDSNGNIPQIPINDYTIKGVITDWLWTNGNGVTADVNSFDSSGSWGVKLAIKINSISRTPLVALNGTLDYVIDLFDESEKLYEFKLPRFSYRYKYEDGEYSHFAPWTDVAFKPGSFDYHPKKGYNLGMTNTVQSVQLTDFVTIDTPLDVVEIDILYKEEKSPNIYIVDTLKPNDHPTIPDDNGVLSNNWNLNKYEISKENIMSILPSNQFLRPYDNVPKKALAQDITGNRVVYGNYVESYNLDINNVDYKPQISHELTHDPSNLKSVKSLREYQLGVVFTDKYGRETPVLTNNTGTFKVDKNQAGNKNKLQLSLGNTTNPLEMEFFKFYIKQTSGEYYNMAMDRWYDAEDGNVWVSFNSADRNKINDDTVLVLKKGVDSEELVEDPARFKVVAIKNEAPDFIKLKKTIISDKAHAVGSAATNIFLTGGDLPEEGSTTFSIAYHDTGTHIYSNTVIKDIYNKEQHQGEEFYFQIKNSAGTTSTKPIKIAKINITDEDWVNSGGLTKFDIVLDEPFSSLIYSFTDDTTGANATKILDDNRAVFWSYKKENRAEFDGRFFVKLFQEDTFKEYVMDNTTAEITQYNTLWDQRVYSFDYSAHNLAWNGASGNLPGGSSYYYASSGNDGNNPTWNHYIDATDDIAQDGSSGYSLQNWKICAAFFRGINIHKGKSSGTPGWKSHGIDQRKGFDSMDLHGDPSSWDFEDVWFLDGAESDGYYSGHWDGSPQTTDHNGIGISGNMLELGFGGIQPEEDSNGSWSWFYDSGGSNGNDADFYQLHNNEYYDNDSEGSGLASRLTAGVYFRWAEDPAQTVYKITNTADHNLVRHETDQLGDDQYDLALGATASTYPLYNEVQYATSTFFRPGNHSKNYVLTVSQIDNPNSTTMPWNPYTLGEIPGGVVLPIVVTTGMSAGGNSVTLNTLSAVDVSGSGYGARTLQVGMVCDELGAVVSKISGTTIYFKNYDSNVVNPTYAAVSAGDTLNFKQYGMNGISRNSAKNINYWNSGKGFGAANVGVDAVGYTIQILEPQVTETVFPRFPAIFETEPTEETGLDIYYEMTDNLPVTLNKNNISYLIPVGSEVAISAQDPAFGYQDGFTVLGTNVYDFNVGSDIVLDVYLGGAPIAIGDEVTITTPEGVKYILLIEGISVTIVSPLRTIFTLSPNLTNQKITPTWFNCYSFGNGVESNRVRDLFNKTYISNGVKVSTVLDEKYKEEHKKYSLIYSGIYNSTSGVNNLNQFIAAEKITKDINPIYGSIQKLYSGWGQGGDLVALCEDRVLKILANKDALYNADGNTNVTSTNNVLGQAIPYSGEYGISKNPESFASEAYRIYFTDKVRGTVMRLSMDGLTPISNHGMKDWFRDHLKLGDKLIGSYDDKKDEYNITIKGDTIAKTVTFKEDVKGWVSFKSFTPENAISCANEYYTFKDGNIWKHHDEFVNRNTFYDQDLVPSSVEVIFNEVPGSVKSFKTVNYEGSQAKVTSKDENGVTLMDGEYFNLADVEGWHVTNVITNLEQGGITEFINKEGKWFGYVIGNDVTINPTGNVSGNYDTEDSSIQGIGRTVGTTTSVVFGCTDDTMFNYNDAATNNDGSCINFSHGCMDPDADNFQFSANTDDGSCYYLGCTTGPLADQEQFGGSINYDPNATVDDGSCIPGVWGCTLLGYFNSNPLANMPSNYCIPINVGCTDSNANNYVALVDEMTDVNTDDGSCEYEGCADPIATNYSFTGSSPVVDGPNGNLTYLNGTAIDDGSCTYVGGCMDNTACNFDVLATIDNGLCYLCADDNADNYDAVTPFTDYTCLGACTYCNDVASVTITNQTTSDAGMSNGTVTIEWPASTSSSVTSYEVYNWNYTILETITSSGNPTETLTITGLEAGTYNIYVKTICTTIDGNTLTAGEHLPGGNTGAGPHFGTPVSTTITSTPILGCTDNTGTNTTLGAAGMTPINGQTWGACNYDATATIDDGSCDYTSCAGCTSPTYVEYDAVFTQPSPSTAIAAGYCTTLIVSGCTDATAFNYNTTNPPNADCAGVVGGTDTSCCVAVALGCTDGTLNNDGSNAASNYNASANTDDGSCNSYNCPTIEITQGLYNTGFRINTYNTPYPQSGGASSYWLGSGTNATIDGNGVMMNPWSSWAPSGTVIGVKTSEPTANYFAAGSTTVDIVFNVITADNNCSITETQTFTIGCMDANADTSGGFDIADNTQCEYTGCMDTTACNFESYYTIADNSSCAYCGDTNAENYDSADPSCTSGCIYAGCMDTTPQADGTGYAASNYDPIATIPCNTSDPQQGGTGPLDPALDNACCTYYADESVIFGDPVSSSGAYAANTLFRVHYNTGNTGYTVGTMPALTLGSPGGTQETVTGTTKNGMNSGSVSRLAHTIIPGGSGAADGLVSQWHNYVHNGSLLVTAASVTFDGTCDNNSLNDALPQGYGIPGQFRSYTVGCKNDSTAANYNVNLDLHLDGSCIAANPGCTDSTATNYDATFNQDCSGDGSGSDYGCCCYTCHAPTWQSTAVSNFIWDAATSPTFATQFDLNWDVVSNASTYTLTHNGSGSFTSLVVTPTITNGVATYVFTNASSTHFEHGTTYTFELEANCVSANGDSCGVSSEEIITQEFNCGC